MPANDHESLGFSEFVCNLLGERLSRRRRDDHASLGEVFAKDCLDPFNNGRRHHHHAGAAAIRGVVGGAMPIVRPGPDVVDGNVDEARVRCPFDDARIEWPGEHLRKKGETIDAHESLA